jgi:hypothetical protein
MAITPNFGQTAFEISLVISFFEKLLNLFSVSLHHTLIAFTANYIIHILHFLENVVLSSFILNAIIFF